MINKKLAIAIFLVLMAIGVSVFWYLKDEKTLTNIESVAFKTNNGWGYNIMVNNKIYIHQDFIPAIKGNQPFKSMNEATKIGLLVMEKLKKGGMPTIKIKELDGLKIRYNKD